MHFFLTICAVAVAISFLGGESAGTDIVSIDGKLKVRKTDFIEFKIPELKAKKKYEIKVYCLYYQKCGNVEVSSEAPKGANFKLRLFGENGPDYGEANENDNQKYVEATINKGSFIVSVETLQPGKNITIDIVGPYLNQAYFRYDPGYKSTVVNRFGALISLDGIEGNNYIVHLRCSDPKCQNPVARGDKTDDVTASVGSEDEPEEFCTLAEEPGNQYYRVCKPDGVTGKDLYLTLSVKKDIAAYEAEFLLKNLDSVAIIEDSPDAS